MKRNEYIEIDMLYILMSYVNVSSNQDMYSTIAHTILRNLDKIPKLSINELADLCYTSPATISRFCKKINCQSFSEFKKAMALALEQAEDEIHFKEDDLQRIEKNPQYLVDKVYLDTIKALKKGQESINIFDVDKICRMIHDASKVHFYGFQFNKIVASDFQLKLLKLKKLIYSFVGREGELEMLDLIDKDSLVIILSVRALPHMINPLIERVKEYHPRILLITLNKEYQNDKIDYIYRISGYESDYTQSSMQGSICFINLLNIIYTRYGLLYKD